MGKEMNQALEEHAEVMRARKIRRTTVRKESLPIPAVMVDPIRKRGSKYDQCGYVRAEGPSWIGYYRINTKQGRKRVSLRVGSKTEMTEAEARLALKAFIHADERVTCGMQRIPRSSRILNMNAETCTDGRKRINLGCMSELAVVMDLMGHGFAVYRTLSPTAPFDLVATHDGVNLLRVEVKTASMLRRSGEVVISLKRQIGMFDILAVVFKDGRIEYRQNSEITNDRFPLGRTFKLTEIENSGRLVGGCA